MSNSKATEFTINRNILLINNYIRNNALLDTNTIICHEILVLINTFYMKQIFQPFGNMVILEKVVKGLNDNNINDANSISQDSILCIMNGDNVITKNKLYRYDKLLTISIMSLQIIDIDINECQVLIISPSREQAQSLFYIIKSISKYISSISFNLCIGGTTIKQDIIQLSNGVSIINGLTERIYQLIKQNAFKINKLKLLILHDANHLYQKGFKYQINEIIKYLPINIQIAIFTSDENQKFELTCLKNEIYIDLDKLINNELKLCLINVKQYYVYVENEKYKFETLCDIFNYLYSKKCIVYTNTMEKVIWLNQEINKNDFDATNILVCTDTDIQMDNVLIINYDLAIDDKLYLSRNGSYINNKEKITKRVSINFVCNDELPISSLESKYNTVMEELPMDIQSII